jgi:hypothetical protein
MPHPKTAVLRLFGAFIVGAAISSIRPAGAEGQAVPSQKLLAYDIPSEGLAAALRAYADVSGVQVLYETALTAGRRSAAVKGTFPPDAALQLLLAGSGLVGRHTDLDAVTILPGPPEPMSVSRTSVLPDAGFLGALQAGILDALCRSDDTQPGLYRLAVQLWIAPDGSVRRVALLGSTGDAHRDTAIATALETISVGTAPPGGMRGPVTMVITPRSASGGEECPGRRR